MKKRIIALTLAFGLAFSIVGQGSVYADEAAAEGTTIATAVARELNTEYSVTWQDGVDESYNIIKLEKNGILDISFTKATNNTLGVLDATVEIYDDKGNAFYYVKDEDDNVTNAHLYVGLKAGTYYVKLAPAYSSYAYNSTSTFQFTFTESTKCELESNNTKNTATKMKVGTAYTGYLGSGFGSIHDNVDGQDLYSVELKKGQAYKLTFDKAEGTTIIKLLGKNVDLGTLWPSVESNDFCLDANQTFVAPYTGTYYLNIYNYSNAQYKYTTKITNVTPKTPSLSSVKAGDDAFTAKWKKVDCTGYQIQYSTDKNFKNAKTTNVSSKNKVSATVKKLASNKKYYVRIRAYRKADSKYAYSSWSKAKTVTTK